MLRKNLTCIALVICPLVGFSQSHKESGIIKLEPLGTLNLSDVPEFGVSIKTQEIAQPIFKRIDGEKQQPTVTTKPNQKFAKKAGPDPVIGFAFSAQSPSGTPLDNNIAISNSGKILSAVNTTIRVYDSLGTIVYGRSLAAIANQLGTLNRTFDPHVLYDPEEDRFILVFLNGSDHTNTNVIVGFSASNDPAGTWNFYKIPGNTESEEWWSDYPFIGLSKNELFISVLLWKDGDTGWDTDAVDENIWQINKHKGYAGDSLETVQYHGLTVSGKPLWNIRPVNMGDKLYGPDFYLLSNRPKDQQNDSIFIIHISGEIGDPNRTLSIDIAKANQPYGLQPNVTQLGGRRLRTNYCDIHEAYRLADKIYFVGNSIDFQTGRPGIAVGRIDELGQSPSVNLTVFGVDSIDLCYPSIAYAGAGWPDQSAAVLCLHNSENAYPGSSVFLMDRDFQASNLVRLYEGEGAMNILSGDSLERWGDYTGAQRRFSNPGEVWVAGSFGRSNATSQTWIAQILNTDPQLGLAPQTKSFEYSLFPNPGSTAKLRFKLEAAQELNFIVRDMQGKTVLQKKAFLTAGEQELTLLQDLQSAVYTVEVYSGAQLLLSDKFVSP
ncbi:MAG: T9SS type A sorting domain-containing protein [Bacteroidetes bacterium]|nr:MAG: T9SS type A sorting domain-containing protein [Bacteroidota bacterium]